MSIPTNPQELLEYVGEKLIFKIAGHQAQALGKEWFQKLFQYEYHNLTNWLVGWSPTDEDMLRVLSNPDLTRLFGYMTRMVKEELFFDKIPLWSAIADNALKSDLDMEKKNSFIKAFETLNLDALKMLGGFKETDELIINKHKGSDQYQDIEYLYLMISFNPLNQMGLVYSKGDYLKITPLGREFVNFLNVNAVQE